MGQSGGMAARLTVTRSIHFYRADTGQDDAGRPLPLDVTATLSAVHTLPWRRERDGGRYIEVGGDDLCAWVDAPARPQRVRFARIRRSALPQSELAGQLTPVQLGQGAGLYEATHLCFFPNNIIGAEFNFYAPRPTRLPRYLARVAGELPTPFALERLLRGDVSEQLRQQRGLRLLELRVHPSYISMVEEANADLASALRAELQLGESARVGVLLQADPRDRRASLGRRALEATRTLAGRPDLRDGASVFRVRGIDADDHVREINLLADAFIVQQEIARLSATSRAVDSDSAYGAITAAYTELRPALERAASLSSGPES